MHKLGRKSPRITGSHASSVEAIGAIFDCNKGKAKSEESTTGEGASDCFNRKKNKKEPRGSLIVVAECKGGRAPDTYPPDFFEIKLEGSCQNHVYPIKHADKDCSLIR